MCGLHNAIDKRVIYGVYMQVHVLKQSLLFVYTYNTI